MGGPLPLNPSSWPPPVPTMTALLFFATATCMWAALELAPKLCSSLLSSSSTLVVPDGAMPAAASKAKPLAANVASVRLLLRKLAELGAILLLCWLAEHRPLFAHGAKRPSALVFGIVCAAIAVAALRSLKRNPDDTAPLNRAQSEEWKGWMQIVFLLYHYMHQGVVYKPVRVFIACYVWMTGFGNFSFFYLKGDFSLSRVVAMLWRLNFLVFWLCMVLNNSLILYYINPLHTFYFLLMWCMMRIGAGRNREPTFLRLKLFATALVIFVVWEYGLAPFIGFRALWGRFLPSIAVVGAKSGAYHEWHFRTSLDHWAVRQLSSFIYRYIPRESCSQFDSLPLTSLTKGVLRRVLRVQLSCLQGVARGRRRGGQRRRRRRGRDCAWN